MDQTHCNRCNTDTTGTSINLQYLNGSTEPICADCYHKIQVCRYDGDGFDLDFDRLQCRLSSQHIKSFKFNTPKGLTDEYPNC